jgi:flavin reductase (DIM6/NTAB) family NADH-FMN oxidoreductase RutF/nitroreductase
MKNKANLLNILLAVVIIILVFQLSYKQENLPKIKNGEAKAVAERHVVDSSVKTSVGIKDYLMPKPAVVIGSYNSDGKPEIMTTSSAGVCNTDPLCIAVSVDPSTLTYKNIMQGKSFTINVPSVKYVAEVDYARNIDGGDDDKFATLGLTSVKGDFVNAPYIQEFPIVMECEVIESVNLGSQTQFIGKVVDTKTDAGLIKENGGIDIASMQPVFLDEEHYYSYGVPVAKPGDAHKLFLDDQTPLFMPSFYGNAVLNIIHERKSVRHFTPQKVSKEQLTTLIKAGMAAPTAVNMQPWKFIAINDTSILNKLAAGSEYAEMLLHAPAAIAVCGNLTNAFPDEFRELWIQDCAAASQNILLAAESMNLGAVWTSTYPGKEVNKAAIETLNLPEHLIPLNVIAIGYPTGEDKKKDKWKGENVFWKYWKEK